MKRLLIALCAFVGLGVLVPVTAHAATDSPPPAATTFTVDQTPTVGVTSTIDASALCPNGGCSFAGSVTWRSPGCCGATHTIIQLERDAVMHWTPTALDATRQYVTIIVKVGVPNPANHLVLVSTYAQSFVVAPLTQPASRISSCTKTFSGGGGGQPNNALTTFCGNPAGAGIQQRAGAHCADGTYHYGPWVYVGSYSHVWCPSSGILEPSSSYQVR